MKKFPVYLLIIFFGISPSLNQVIAQQNDFQCWPFVQLNLEVIKNLRVTVEEEARFRENCTQIGRQLNNIGVSYRFNKYLKAALTYRIEADWKNPDEYVWRNGVMGDVALRYIAGRLTIGYRLRVQSNKVEFSEKKDSWFNGVRNRHKLTLEYDLKGIPLVPIVEGELFANLAGSKGSSVSSYRAWVGMSYILGKKHEISLKYGIDQELNTVDPLRAYVIAIGYTLNIKLPSVK